MTARAAGAGALVIAVIVLIVVLAGGGSTPYKLTMMLDNANGLADGSAVNIGGIPVGHVKLGIDHGNGMVQITLDVDKKYEPVGRDVKASIVAQNVLGQKQVELTQGNRQNPAPDGYVIPAKQISVDTDLDQLLQVLDPQTRARLAVLVNEAGIAFTGRRVDLSQVLKTAPDSLAQAANLLQQLNTNNAALSDALAKSNTYVADTTAQRAGLERLVDQVGQASETAATRTAQLKATLATTPGTLARARELLTSINTTATPLGSAAKLLTATSTPLRATLTAIDPFQSEAKPALQAAVNVAPELGNLASGATPTLRKAVPMVRQLKTFVAQTLPGGTDTLNHSIDNVLAVIENWSRAIQFRDGLSHIFRAEVSISPNMLTSAISRLNTIINQTGNSGKGTGVSGEKKPKPGAAGTSTTTPASTPGATSTPGQSLGSTLSGILGSAVPGVTKTLSGVTSSLTHPGSQSSPSASGNSVQNLLHFLLGH